LLAWALFLIDDNLPLGCRRNCHYSRKTWRSLLPRADPERPGEEFLKGEKPVEPP